MQPKVLTIEENDLLPILTMQYQERKRDPSSSHILTQKAQSLAGDQTDAQTLLRIRANLWHLSHPMHAKPAFPLRYFGYVLCFGAFLFGFGLDALSNPQQTINLLAPPILLFLIWQLFSYIFLLVRPWRWFSHDPIQTPALFRLWEKLHQKWMLPRSYVNLFCQIERIRRPVTILEWQRLWHLASLFLALGIILGIAWQGIGTEFTIGWTSTWFKNYPDRIGQLLAALYTHSPFTLWSGEIPQAQDIALLNLHRHPAGSPEAAFWLFRFMRLIVLWVVIPRLCFALWCSWKLRSVRKNLVLPIDTPYYQAILNIQTRVTPKTLTLFYAPMRRHTLTALTQLQNLLSSHAVFTQIDTHVMDYWRWNELPSLSQEQEKGYIAFLMPAQSTPEEEVHGRLLRATKNAYPQAQCAVWVIVDELYRRFARQDARIQSRLTLWEKFILRHQMTPLWLRLQNPETQERFLRTNFSQKEA